MTVRKYDLLGSWSTGVPSRNSDTGAWNLITGSAVTSIAAGDMHGDGKADLAGNPRIGYVAQHLVQYGSSCTAHEDYRAVRFVFFNKP